LEARNGVINQMQMELEVRFIDLFLKICYPLIEKGSDGEE
jgi:hypothetical protein